MENTFPINETYFALARHGLRVDFDASQIFPEDPGAGTPVLVALHGETGTYHCVCETREIVGDETTYLLTETQIAWLHKIHDKVEGWLQHHRAARNAKSC